MEIQRTATELFLLDGIFRQMRRNNTMNYTVIVAEDEELLLNNLVHKIEKADPDFQVIGTAQTGAQALSLVEQMSPDVVLRISRCPSWTESPCSPGSVISFPLRNL